MAVLITLAVVAVVAAMCVRTAATARRARPRRQNFFGDYPRSVVAGLDTASQPEAYRR